MLRIRGLRHVSRWASNSEMNHRSTGPNRMRIQPWRPVKLTLEATKLLRRLVLLNRTEGHPDSPENPLLTRNLRLLELRKKLVQALSK